MVLRATTRAKIFGKYSCWSSSPLPGVGEESKDCVVELEIQASGPSGYHLVKAPDGFFTADDWYESEEEAMGAAFEEFGVRRSEWRGSNNEPG
jgi:hypothetical protein